MIRYASNADATTPTYGFGESMSCLMPTTNDVRARPPAEAEPVGVDDGASSATAGTGTANAVRAAARTAATTVRRFIAFSLGGSGCGRLPSGDAAGVHQHSAAGGPRATGRSGHPGAPRAARDRVDGRLRVDPRPQQPAAHGLPARRTHAL